MDVDKVSFYPLLLDILTDISEAHFVTFDLELSGIPTKQIRNDVGKASLQERYLETKEAAERYQILQFGITCVQQDVANGKYILKPYNFDLSPLIDERGLDVERIFSFQSGACDFLLRVGFDLSRPFLRGVPYLSRAESREAREKHAKRQDKSTIADIQIKPTEIESLAFMERVRGEIHAWLACKKMETADYVNIGPQLAEDAKSTEQMGAELSRFEKRLVHQLVRAEFADLVAISRRGFIQIVRFDKEREERILADRKRAMNASVNRQKGFRWVIEALLGSNLNNLDLQECAKDPITGEAIFFDMNEFRAQFNRAHGLLRGNPRMLVGHNCFLDLVYIYRTFIGKLPDTVTEFQEKLHALWPSIVDTKYMSTHNCGDINPVSSLEQIASQLSEQKVPVVEIDPDHNKYINVEAFHEAGYDSYLTAQIAVRLSSKLEREGAYIDITSGQTTPKANELTNGIAGMKLTASNLQALNAAPSANGHVSSTEHSDPEDPAEPAQPVAAEGFVESVLGFRWKRRGDPTVPPSGAVDDPFVYDPKNLQHRHQDMEAERCIPDGMPELGSDFWRVYGNKLRVFGTEEGMCVLDGGEVLGVSSDDEVGEGQGGVVVERP